MTLKIIITNKNCKLIHCKQRVSYRTKVETTGIVYISQQASMKITVYLFCNCKMQFLIFMTMYIYKETRKSVDGEPSHIPALIKANRIEASYFLAYVAKYG